MFDTFLLLFVWAPFWRFFRTFLIIALSSCRRCAFWYAGAGQKYVCNMYRDVMHTFSAIHLWLQLRWYLRIEHSLAVSFFFSSCIPLRHRCTPSLRASSQSAASTAAAVWHHLSFYIVHRHQSVNPLCIDCVITLFTEAKIVISSRVCSARRGAVRRIFSIFSKY